MWVKSKVVDPDLTVSGCFGRIGVRIWKLVEINPLNHGGGPLYAPSSLAFCRLLKIFFRHPYLKILDLADLFVLTPSQSTLKYGSENRPWVRGLRVNFIRSNPGHD